MLDLKAYFTLSVDNNSNNVCSVGSCTPLHPSLVTGSLLRVICSPRKLRLQMTLVGLPVTKSGCKGVQRLRTYIIVILNYLNLNNLEEIKM